jgi:hypothetical protein
LREILLAAALIVTEGEFGRISRMCQWKPKAPLLLSRLFVDLAPMPNARYLHHFLFVIDGVDNAIISNADTPRILSAT